MKKIIIIALTIAMFGVVFSGCHIRKDNVILRVEAAEIPANAIQPAQEIKEFDEADRVDNCSLIIIQPTSDFTIIRSSEYFEKSNDRIEYPAAKVTGEYDTRFITNAHGDNKMFVCDMSNDLSIDDSVIIMPDTQQAINTTYKLMSDRGTLVATSGFANEIEMVYAGRTVKMSSVFLDFTYQYRSENSRGGYDITIHGYTSTNTDVVINYDGDAYVVTSTEPIEELTIAVGGVTVEATNNSMSYRIHINDGVATIENN